MPSSASTDIAAATLAVRSSRSASAASSAPSADISWVPLRSARPSFAPSRSGSRPVSFKRDERRPDVPGELHLAAPDERQREVRERRQVARGAHGPLRRHDRVDPDAEEVEEALGHDRPSAGVPQGERVGPQQEHRPDDLARERLAHARGVADEQVLLEPLGVGPVDRAVREGAHAGRDAVHDRALVDQRLDHRAGALHPRTSGRIEGRLRAAAGHCLHVADGQVGARQDHRVGHRGRIVG